LNARRLSHITTQSENLHAQCLQFLRSLQATLFLARTKNQIRAHFSEPFRHLTAEPDGATGNDGHATGKVEDFLSLHAGLFGTKYSCSFRVALAYIIC
jgi:hypothetical protein